MAINATNTVKKGPDSKYNQSRHDSIIRDLSVGLTRECASKRAGIGERTLARWIKWGKQGVEPYTALVTALKKAEADAEALAIETIRKVGMGEWTEEEVITTTTTKDGHTTTQTKRKKGRPEWTALAWWAERKRPDEWGKDVELLRQIKAEFLKRKQAPDAVADVPATTD